MATDFRDNQGYPRSGRERSGDFMWLLRVFDKARAAAAGTDFDYIYPCPIDQGMMERWGITAAEFNAAIAAHADDAAIFAWLSARASKAAIDRANAWLVLTKSENLDRQDREERGAQPRTGGPICTNCGVAYPPAERAPERCPICEDERVTGPATQAWTTMRDLAATHACVVQPCEPGITGIGVTPAFAIGQRALLVEQSDGCILWDCLSLIDAEAVDYINTQGGLKAIAVSHPHFYGAMVEWSRAFGDVPVYVHEADRDWVVNAAPGIVFWSGDTLEIAPGVTLVRCGGHFDGATVMHVAQAASGRGALLAGDTIMVSQLGCGVSFMYSYPTYVPLHADQVRHLQTVIAPFPFATIYGCWVGHEIESDGSALVARTAQRHLDILHA